MNEGKPITINNYLATQGNDPTKVMNEAVDSRRYVEADGLSETAIEQIKKLFNAKPLVQYSCHSCGATLELEPENHIFKCKYCGHAYMVGLDQINSRK